MTIRELKSISLLAIPLVIGQLGQMLLGIFDTIMVGKLGVLDLAALSFANSLFIVPFVFAIGILTSISMCTSKARGLDDHQKARSICRNGLILSTVIGILFFALTLAFIPLLDKLGQPPEVVQRSYGYYTIIMASLIPCCMSLALKNHADALNRPWPAFWIFMLGVLLNVALNAGFIFGKWGFPELGLEGAAIATLITRCVIVVAMVLWFKSASSLREWTPKHWLKRPDFSEIKQLTTLGLPAGLQTLAEISTFAVAGILIGHFGAAPLAAHQITLQTNGMGFMLPLGLSMALTVRMGEIHNDPQRQRNIVTSGWFLTLLCSCSTAFLFIFARTQIAEIFVMDTEIIALASGFLVVAGLFQITDGLQIASTGMLRGLHDTKTPAKIAIFSYWVIGIPSGYLLANHTELGPVGIWWGLAIGLGVAAILLSKRLWSAMRTHTI